MQLAVVTGLTPIGSADTEQSHELQPELHCVAVDDLEAWPRARPDGSVDVGLRMCREGKDEGQKAKGDISRCSLSRDFARAVPSDCGFARTGDADCALAEFSANDLSIG